MTNTRIACNKVQLTNPLFLIIYQEYDQYIRARNIAIIGEGEYQVAVKDFLYWLEQKCIYKINRIKSIHMVEYHEYLCTRPNKRKEGKLAQSTINHQLFSLRMLIDYL